MKIDESAAEGKLDFHRNDVVEVRAGLVYVVSCRCKTPRLGVAVVLQSDLGQSVRYGQVGPAGDGPPVRYIFPYGHCDAVSDSDSVLEEEPAVITQPA